MNPVFQIADARQILIKLLAIRAAQRALQGMGVFEHRIEHARPQAATLESLRVVRIIREEPVEDLFRLDFSWQRRRRIAPGQRVLIDARIAAVAVPRAAEFFDADFEDAALKRSRNLRGIRIFRQGKAPPEFAVKAFGQVVLFIFGGFFLV